VSEAQEISLNHNCQFLEVSAAESYSGVQLAFHSLLKETRSSQMHRSLPIRRKLGVNSVSKVRLTSSLFFLNSSSSLSLSFSRIVTTKGAGQHIRQEQQERSEEAVVEHMTMRTAAAAKIGGK
jgi:hypothetical protein